MARAGRSAALVHSKDSISKRQVILCHSVNKILSTVVKQMMVVKAAGWIMRLIISKKMVVSIQRQAILTMHESWDIAILSPQPLGQQTQVCDSNA